MVGHMLCEFERAVGRESLVSKTCNTCINKSAVRTYWKKSNLQAAESREGKDIIVPHDDEENLAEERPARPQIL